MSESREQVEERGRQIVAIKWSAYKAIRSGGSYSLGDKKLYESVRHRLKRMFLTDEPLTRFRLLK